MRKGSRLFPLKKVLQWNPANQKQAVFSEFSAVIPTLDGAEKLLPRFHKGADLGIYAILHCFGFSVDALPAVILPDKV